MLTIMGSIKTSKASRSRGGDSATLQHSAETPPAGLGPALEPSVQHRQGPVELGPKEATKVVQGLELLCPERWEMPYPWQHPSFQRKLLCNPANLPAQNKALGFGGAQERNNKFESHSNQAISCLCSMTELGGIIRVISFFSSRLEQAGAELSVERVLEIIKQGAIALPKDRLRKFPELKFKYVEEEQPEEFFIPYVWSLVYNSAVALYWNPQDIQLFTMDSG